MKKNTFLSTWFFLLALVCFSWGWSFALASDTQEIIEKEEAYPHVFFEGDLQERFTYDPKGPPF